MYEAFFGLKQTPFSISPDPRYLYMSERHRDALAHLRFALESPGGFVLLTGEVGAGKTTLSRWFLQHMPEHFRVAYIFNPKLSATELLESICDEFHVPLPKKGTGDLSIKDCIDPLNEFLLSTHAAGGHCVLVIDEAQNLSNEVLEQLRLLTNLETSERKLLQIILVGQPELRDQLAEPELEQLNQRITARFHLEPLNEGETARYLAHRLKVAGRHGPLPIDRDGLRRIHQLSGGVPRRINLLADRALLGAYARNASIVGEEIVVRAANEVFDERRRRRRRTSTGVSHFAHWWWALAGFAALGLALGAITWWWSERDGPRMAQAAPPAANAINPADIAAVAKARGAAAPWMASGASAPALATLAAASPSAIQATLATAYEGDPGALQVFDPNRDALDLYTKPEQAWRALAAYWTDKVPEGKVCDALAEQHLSCHMNGGGTTDLLSRLDRPVILKLIVGGRALRVVLLGLNAERARIEADGKQWVVPTDALDRMWRGEYGTLWFPPEGYLRPLRPGDTGPAARALATALVRLHPAPDPNLGQDYDPYTRLRLAEFQRSNDLPMSTSVGPETFMMLHRLNGLPEPRLALE